MPGSSTRHNQKTGAEMLFPKPFSLASGQRSAGIARSQERKAFVKRCSFGFSWNYMNVGQ